MYLKNVRNVNPQQFHAQRNNPLVRQMNQAQNNGKVDVLRLSHNVKRNMMKESEGADENYNPGQPSAPATVQHQFPRDELSTINEGRV